MKEATLSRLVPSLERKTNFSWLLLAVVLGIVLGALPWFFASNWLLTGAAIILVASFLFLVGAWPLSGVATLIVAALLTRYRFDVGPVSIRPEQIAALTVAALGGFQLLIRRGRLRMPLAAWFALAWWGMNVISGIFFSPRLVTGIQNSIRLSLLALTFILIINLISDRQQWRLAILIFLGAGIVEAAFGIVARALYPLGINLGVQVAWNFTEPIPYGTFEEGNLFGSHTGSWAIVLATMILANGVHVPRIRTWLSQGKLLHHVFSRQTLRLLGLLILLLALFLSLSRGAWLMFVAGMALLWLVYTWNAWHTVNRFLLLLTAVPFLVFSIAAIAPLLPSTWPFVERIQSFLNLSSDPTFSARLSDWMLALDDWRRQPLTGWGPGSFYDIYGELRAHPAWISNLSIRLLQETGLIGTGLFLGFTLSLFLPVLKTLHRSQMKAERMMLLGLSISLLVLWGLAYQSTDGIWLSASWVHAGLLAAGARVLGNMPTQETRP